MSADLGGRDSLGLGCATSRNGGAVFPGIPDQQGVCVGGRGMVLGEWADDWELPVKQKERGVHGR